MNLNLLTIDALQTTPNQALYSNPSRGIGTADGSGEIDSLTVNNGGESPKSYNVSRETHISKSESVKSTFENVFRQKLKANEPQSESCDGKAAVKPQKSSSDDKNKQVRHIIALFNGLPALALQKQQNTDVKPASNLAKLTNKQQITPQTTTKSPKAPKFTLGINLQNAKSNASQDTRPAIAITQNQSQLRGVRQTSGQEQPTGESPKLVDGGQATSKTKVVPAQLIQTANLNKTAESTHQRKPSENTESVNTKAPMFILGVKLTDAKSGTNITKEVVSRGQEQITAVAAGRVETTNSRRAQGKPTISNADRQTSPRPVSRNEKDINKSAEKLNVEKAEIFSIKNDAPKAESGFEMINQPKEPITTIGSGRAVEAGAQVISKNFTNTINNPLPDNVANVREQIYQSIKTTIGQGQNQITIRLNPPELGQVSVKFSEQGKEITGLFEATNPQTRADIRQALPEIIRSLEESGVSIKRLDVVLADTPRQPSQQSFRDNPSQDLWQQFGQHSSQDPGSRPSQDSYATPVYPSDSSENYFNRQSSSQNQFSSSDKLLDVLI